MEVSEIVKGVAIVAVVLAGVSGLIHRVRRERKAKGKSVGLPKRVKPALVAKPKARKSKGD